MASWSAHRARQCRVDLDRFIANLEFSGADRLKPAAIEAADCAATLKREIKRRSLPVIYANDNFGRWKAEFSKLVEDFCHPGCAGDELVQRLQLEADDLSDPSTSKSRLDAFIA